MLPRATRPHACRFLRAFDRLVRRISFRREVWVSEQPRRRLRLMNEVLPDPLLNQVRVGTARDRTMRHYQALLATAAASTLAPGCGAQDESPKPDSTPSSVTATSTASSSKPGPSGSAVVQTDPVPPASSKPVASAGQDPPDTAKLPDAGTPHVVPPQPPNTGFMVVDPVPQPFRKPPPKSGGVP
jgi:hypothetical protein